MHFFRNALLLLTLLAVAGCGYGFSRGKSVLPEQYRTLAIAEVKNPAPLSWLEPRVRSLLRDEVTRRGLAEWASGERADALITIEIEKYYRRASVTGEDEETLQSDAKFVFEGIIRSSVDGSVIWRSGTISQDWPFQAGEEDEADAKVTELGIRRLADRMANDF
ncbi:LPS assembly lipoprotein LptE [Desulfovibrio oxyclinae]|jgi:hypothetical protein|uniref:LPS assembly lipoprotein LptE n=1 Tax=Desulfovibrio oxyclinae TaxID=63560 RepID=UPI00037C824D|nr:LPS assembly lipoprotein LptE [Desulfovibrio oxyclinae]